MVTNIFSPRSIWCSLCFLVMPSSRLTLQSKSTRRPLMHDDVSSWGRLPVLSSPYYSAALCDVAAMLAVSYRIERVHRNPWIGFQPWRLASEKVSR